MWDHTVLPATRQSWHCRPYHSQSWYSIKRPRSDARLSCSWLVTYRDGIPPEDGHQRRNDGVAAASSDGGHTGGRGPPTVLFYFKSDGRGPDLRKWRGAPDGCVTPLTVTHPSTNRARRGLTSFMQRTPLTTTPRRHVHSRCSVANRIVWVLLFVRVKCVCTHRRWSAVIYCFAKRRHLQQASAANAEVEQQNSSMH